MIDRINLSERFREEWGFQPQIFHAPGRVNLIGEHTDYNEGFVLPAAIQLQTRVAAGPGPERKIHVKSLAYPDEAVFDLDHPHKGPQHHWSDYVSGVALSLERSGSVLNGARLLIDGDLPPGAGLSSSAALEVATALALLSNSGIHLELAEVANVCHRAENEFVGIRSGVMDQFASCFGRRDHALLLDCRSLEMKYVPVPRGVVMMVCNTMVRHQLASGEYNSRRSQCEEGVRILSNFLPGIRALRDVTAPELAKFGAELDPVIHRRCRHVVEENRRVLMAVQALDEGDMQNCGDLMMQSHQSLRLDYEVSCPELDVMCELASTVKGVYGARMVGGGFGGCALALVEESASEAFREAVFREYRKRTGIDCEIYECFADEGAGPLGD